MSFRGLTEADSPEGERPLPAPAEEPSSVLEEVRALPEPYRNAIYLHYYEGYTAADHLAALLRHGTADMVELCLANSSPIPPELAERYRAEGAEALTVDRERIAQMGIELVERPLASPSGDFARHDPDALASAVLDIYRARAVHIYGGSESYRIEK